MSEFVHFHCHNEYSLLDGYGTAEQYVAEAKNLRMTSLGCTNHGNVDGCIKFQNACKEGGITPIIGCELYVVKDLVCTEKKEKRYHALALVKNETGWTNLLKMLTLANTEGFHYKPRVSPEMMLKHSEGLVMCSACSSSFIRADWGEKLLLGLKELLDKDLYLEVMPHSMKEQCDTNILAVSLSKKYDIPLCASNDCHYPTAVGAEYQEVLLAIQSRTVWNDPKRWKFDINTLYLKNNRQMFKDFISQRCLEKEDILQAFEGGQEIASKCKFLIPKLPVNLPKVVGHETEDETELLSSLLKTGFKQRILSNPKRSKNRPVYQARLDEEFKSICELGFQKYFAIVWELINWCKNNDIMVGPGRGSVGGSLLAYLLYITDVDPIEHKLLFSRFISPARIDLPDIDMDFEDRKRHLVRKHLEDSYGKNNIAGLSTFSTMKGRGAIRDVSRVFAVPRKDVDAASKSIVVRSGGDNRCDFTIEDSFETFEDGIAFKKNYPDVARISMALEGQVRGAGQHAAAMCISSEDLREGKRCSIAMRNKVAVANWDKYDAEHVGLMKLDILGLSALTVLSECKDQIKINHDVDIEYSKLDMEDADTYAEINAGNTVGIFQIGSPGLSRYCRELGVSCFKDVVDATSLWRPGTLRSGMTTIFQQRKAGAKWKSIHPRIDELTKDTYGIVLYQEQVMQFMYDLAGLPWRTCDIIRKVISKSQGNELFQSFRAKFVEGCVSKNTLDEESAGRVWDELSTFGSYGFNRCVSGDTTVMVPSGAKRKNPKRIAIKDLHNSEEREIFIYDPICKRSKVARIKNVYKTGKKPVFELVCINNRRRSIKTSAEHQFLTRNGWKQLKELKTGDEVMIKLASTILCGKENPLYGKMTGNKFNVGNHEPRGPMSVAWKSSLSVAARNRTIQGHKGCKHSDDTKAVLRAKTLKQYSDGNISTTMTKPHLAVCEGMKSAGIWEGFCNEHVVGNLFSVDIANPSLKIAIEINGDYWHANPKIYSKRNYVQGRNVGRDTIKARYLEKNGWTLLVFWESDIKANLQKCIEDIKVLLKDYDPNPWGFVKVEGIYPAGEEDTYDIEVDDDDHNYIANMFVVHNSHAVEYSMITYWEMYLKVHYPAEYMAASLSYGNKEEKNDYIQEAIRLGLQIVLPKIGVSDAHNWKAKGKQLFVPISEIKGVGEATVELIKQSIPKREGFFNVVAPVRKLNKSVVAKLEALKAYDKNCILDDKERESVRDLFSFDISNNPMGRMKGVFDLLRSKKLIKTIAEIDFTKPNHNFEWMIIRMRDLKFGYRKNVKEAKSSNTDMAGVKGNMGGAYGFIDDLTDKCMSVFSGSAYAVHKDEVEHCNGKWMLVKFNHDAISTNIAIHDLVSADDLMTANFGGFEESEKLIDRITGEFDPISDCSECALREECRSPIVCEIGDSNVLVLGEAPGKDEDKVGKAFSGASGRMLWQELAERGIKRSSVCVSNVVKCFPSKTKTPSKRHIDKCYSKHLAEEIAAISPAVILALGNTPLYALTGAEGGITNLNSTVQWIPKCNAWVVWCLHPASVLYDSSNGAAFGQALDLFANRCKKLGMV